MINSTQSINLMAVYIDTKTQMNFLADSRYMDVIFCAAVVINMFPSLVSKSKNNSYIKKLTGGLQAVWPQAMPTDTRL